MSSADLARYENAFAKMDRSDLLALAGRLIELAQSKEAKSAASPTDLHEFYGSVHFSEDGVEYQRRIRNEWG